MKAAEEAIEEARRSLTEGGLDRLNAAAESLTKVSHRIAEALYKTQQNAAAAGGAGASGAGDGASGAGSGDGKSSSGQGDVVDAEFVDVDESKKPN